MAKFSLQIPVVKEIPIDGGLLQKGSHWGDSKGPMWQHHVDSAGKSKKAENATLEVRKSNESSRREGWLTEWFVLPFANCQKTHWPDDANLTATKYHRPSTNRCKHSRNNGNVFEPERKTGSILRFMHQLELQIFLQVLRDIEQ